MVFYHRRDDGAKRKSGFWEKRKPRILSWSESRDQVSDSKPNALRGGQYKRSYCERKGGTLVRLSLLVRKEERADLSELA